MNMYINIRTLPCPFASPFTISNVTALPPMHTLGNGLKGKSRLISRQANSMRLRPFQGRGLKDSMESQSVCSLWGGYD